MSDLLSIRGLGLKIDGKEILRGVDMELASGEIKGVMGPNGAGKSTLLRLLAGELQPTTGELTLCGQDMSERPEREFSRDGISYISQRPGPFRDLTVEENLRGAAQRGSLFSRKSVRGKVDRLAKLIDMERKTDVVVSELSYGEMRTLDVAMALASEPLLLLADEPTAGVSGGVAGDIVDLFKDLCESNRNTPFHLDGLIFVEHDKGTVFNLADRVGFLHDGRLVVEGTPESIRQHGVVAQYLSEHEFD